jgi:thiol-disulfide isomerase/thioredoxin
MPPARLFVVVALILTAGCQVRTSETDGAAQEAPNPVETTPEAVEKPFDLAAYKGRVVLVDFCALWSDACRAEVPDLNKIRAEYDGSDLEIVGLALDKGGAKSVSDAVRELQIAYPVLMADDSAKASLGAVRVIPTKHLVDRQGQVRKTFAGVVPADDIRKEIASLIAE